MDGHLEVMGLVVHHNWKASDWERAVLGQKEDLEAGLRNFGDIFLIFSLSARATGPRWLASQKANLEE